MSDQNHHPGAPFPGGQIPPKGHPGADIHGGHSRPGYGSSDIEPTPVREQSDFWADAEEQAARYQATGPHQEDVVIQSLVESINELTTGGADPGAVRKARSAIHSAKLLLDERHRDRVEQYEADTPVPDFGGAHGAVYFCWGSMVITVNPGEAPVLSRPGQPDVVFKDMTHVNPETYADTPGAVTITTDRLYGALIDPVPGPMPTPPGAPESYVDFSRRESIMPGIEDRARLRAAEAAPVAPAGLAQAHEAIIEEMRVPADRKFEATFGKLPATTTPAATVRELVEALEDVLRTGLNGGNNVRLAFIAASQQVLSDEDLARADESEAATERARKALEEARKILRITEVVTLKEQS